MKTTYTINHYLLEQFTKIFSLSPKFINCHSHHQTKKYTPTQIQLLKDIIAQITTTLKLNEIEFSTDPSAANITDCPINQFVSTLLRLIQNTTITESCQSYNMDVFKERSLEDWAAVRKELLQLGLFQMPCEARYINSQTHLQLGIQQQYEHITKIFNSLYESLKATIQDHLKIKEKSNSSNFMTTSERCFYTKLNQLMERITPLYVDEHFIQRVIPTSIRYPTSRK